MCCVGHFVFLVHGRGVRTIFADVVGEIPCLLLYWVPFFFPTELTWIVFRPSLVSFLAMSWTNKNKAEIFEHLEEIGISRSAARELLRTPPEKEPTKKGGLLLIKAAVRPISGASLMYSPWAEVVQAVSANFQLDLPEEEQHGLRASFMTRWTAFSLEAIPSRVSMLARWCWRRSSI